MMIPRVRLTLGILWIGLITGLAVATLKGHHPWSPEIVAGLNSQAVTSASGLTNILVAINGELTVDELVTLFCWWTGVVNLFLLTALWLSVPAWARSPGRTDIPPATRKRISPGHVGMLVICLSVALAHAIPRLSHSLWGDEEYTLRHHVHGHWMRLPDIFEGKPFFARLYTDDIAWRYHNTNNHFLYSIVGKFSLRAWQSLADKDYWEFSEPVLRAWPLLLGILAIPLWALFAQRLGHGKAGIILAALLAIHPWYIRYTTEARGYAFVFFFLAVVLHSFLSIVRDGRWRWWCIFGAAEALMLYSWPGTGLVAVVLNLALLVTLARKTDGRDRGTAIKQWFVTNLIVVMALVQLVAPCIPQAVRYFREDQLNLPLNFSWLSNLGGFFFCGTDWLSSYANPAVNPLYLSVQTISEKIPHTVPLAGAMLLLALTGTIRLVAKTPYGGTTAAITLLPPVILTALCYISGGYIFYWYFVYALPLLLLAVGVGLETLLSPLSRMLRPHHTRALSTVAATVLLGLYYPVVSEKLGILRNHSTDPLRESVLAMRPPADLAGTPPQREILAAHINYSALVYDPSAYLIENATSQGPLEPGLTTLMRWADTRGVPLLLNLGFPDDTRKIMPDVMALVDSPGLFEKIRTLQGIEPQFERVIYRYKGGLFEAFKHPGDPTR